MLVIEILSDYWEAAEHFIILYWADQFHLVFLVPAFYLTREFSQSRYRSAIKMLLFRKKNRSHVFFIINISNFTLYLEVVFFFIETLMVMAESFEDSMNKEIFAMWALVVRLIIFVGIPSLIIFWQFSIKNLLIKDGVYLIDHVNYEKILPRSWMIFIIILIVVEFLSFATPINYYLQFLDSLTDVLKPFTDIWRSIGSTILHHWNDFLFFISALFEIHPK